MVSRVYLVAGLGNPGARYSRTRHNAGFMLVDRLAERARERFATREAESLVCCFEGDHGRIVLAKPQTFMNLSGRALAALRHRYEVRLENILVVFDDISLPLGKIRLRRGGGAGGHNGMRSIIDDLESAEIPRLKIGILGDDAPENLTEHVLSDFEAREFEVLDEVLDRAAEATQFWVRHGMDQAMAQYN